LKGGIYVPEGERVKWLRQTLANTAHDKIREAHADKRDPKLERPLDVMLIESSVRLEAWLAA
jgi:hypothetical protein